MSFIENALSHLNATTILLGIIVALVVRWFLTRQRLPPGPWGLPVVGYIPFLDKNKLYKNFYDLSKKWGPVYTLTIGTVPTVILNDYASVKEALMKDTVNGRPKVNPFNLMKDLKSFGAEQGEFWREHRRFSLHVLRDLGLGKSVFEQHLREEVKYIMDETAKQEGKPFKINTIIVPSMSNNIASVLFGKRYDFNSPKHKILDSILSTIQSDFAKVAFLVFFPELLPVVKVFKPTWFQEFLKSRSSFIEFIQKEVEENRKTFDPDNVRDFIDAYILEQKKQKDNPKSTFTAEALIGSASFFFGAGSETVRVSVEFLLLLMALNQNVQDKARAEIDDIIGRERLPEWSDNAHMPYTQAVIMEMHRWASIVPIGLTRATTEDTTVQGHFIPKGTSVIYNIYAVHHDPEYWKDPATFNPERFPSPDGKGLKKSDHLVPFAIGKRSCPGEGLANVEVFLYFTAFLQKFIVKPPEGKTINMKTTLGVALTTDPQELCFVPRL